MTDKLTPEQIAEIEGFIDSLKCMRIEKKTAALLPHVRITTYGMDRIYGYFAALLASHASLVAELEKWKDEAAGLNGTLNDYKAMPAAREWCTDWENAPRDQQLLVAFEGQFSWVIFMANWSSMHQRFWASGHAEPTHYCLITPPSGN